jgi:flagellar hook-length control protein FliK
MNLNPLFFNKLTVEADLSKSNSSINESQNYLFADIITVSQEVIEKEDINVKSSTIDLLLANINDLEIDIPVSEEQINELKKIISNPTFSKDNSSKDLYHLENTDIVKTKQLISEPELAFFIKIINQIFGTIIPEAGIDFMSTENGLDVDAESSDSESNSPAEVLTLDLVRNALQNHDQVKFTFKSGAEKITYQISSQELINNIPLVNQPEPLVQQIELSSDEINNPELTQPSSRDSLVNKKDVTVNQEQDISNFKLVEKNFNNESTITSPEKVVKDEAEYSNNNDGKIYKIEGYYSESNTISSASGTGIKTPFILDINTSKEIGMFLNKYNFEKEFVPKSHEVSENPGLKTDTDEIIKETKGITNIPGKESILHLVNSEELDKDIDAKNRYTIKKDSSEYLRSIKIESGNTVINENKNIIVDKIITTLKNDSSLLSNTVTDGPSKTDVPVINEAEIKNLVFDVEKQTSIKNATQPFLNTEKEKFDHLFNIESESKVNNQTQQTETIKNIRQFDFNIMPAKSSENPTQRTRITNKVKDSELITYNEDTSKEENPELVKSDTGITKGFKDTTTNVNYNSTKNNSNDLQKENDTVEDKENISDKKTETIKSKLSEENRKQELATNSAKESAKQIEYQNQTGFNKRIDQVDKLNHKIVSDVSVFAETVKKVKSSDLVSEINKYLLSNEKQSITFQLTPKNLGTVKLIVDYVDNQVSANIEVDNEQVKQTVQSNLEQLRSTLQNNGIQLTNINVSLNNGEPKANKQFSQKRKNYGGTSGFKVDQKNDLSGKKKMGYNTYEYLA